MTEDIRLLSGFKALIDGVKTYFTAKGITAAVSTGYRERARQLNQGAGGANRVIFLPGEPGGAGGPIEPPLDVGRQDIMDTADPPVRAYELRSLASWGRRFTISIWGWDADAPRDELAQSVAVEELLEKTVRAVEQVKGAGGPNIAWGATTWTIPKENTMGAELLVSCELAHPLMDEPDEVLHPDFEFTKTPPEDP